jgi:ribose transport system permease protein
MKNKPSIMSIIGRWPPVVWMLIALIVIFGITVPGCFEWGNISNILAQSVPLLILAFAQTLVILTQGVDLSIGAQVNFCTVIWIIMANNGIPLAAGAVISVAATVMIGVLNGLIIGKGNISPFIATLGTQYVFNGITLLITAGASVYFSSYLFQLVAETKFLFLPLPVWIAIAVFAITWLMLYRTKFGTNIIGLGGNAEALSLAGISINKSLVKTYAYAGLLAGIAGLITACRVESGQPTVASGWEFEAMAAVLLGGTSLIEGKGSLVGTIFGVFLIEILQNGLNLAGVNALYQNALIGVIVLAAIVLDCLARRYGKNWGVSYE